MWRIILPLVLLISFSFRHSALSASVILYVSENGDKRIAVYRLDEATGDLTRTGAAELPGSPGSLAISPDHKHLYASVRTTKQFASLAIDATTGALSNPTFADAGSNPTYLFADPTGRWLLAASYTEALISSSAIKNGRVDGAPIFTLATGKQAHCIQTDPTNRFAFAPHVGELNKVEQLRFDAETGTLTRNDPPHMPGGEGQGPRHLQFHPNGRWVYLVNEQGKSVTLCDYDASRGTLTIRQTVSTVPPGWDPTKGTCADIHVSADGRFIYASNRGHDSLAIFSIDAKTGELTSLGQTPTEKTPRSFCLTPGGENFVVAAGEGSQRLIVYRRNAETGALTPLKTYDCGLAPSWVLGVKLD